MWERMIRKVANRINDLKDLARNRNRNVEKVRRIDLALVQVTKMNHQNVILQCDVYKKIQSKIKKRVKGRLKVIIDPKA